MELGNQAESGLDTETDPGMDTETDSEVTTHTKRSYQPHNQEEEEQEYSEGALERDRSRTSSPSTPTTPTAPTTPNKRSRRNPSVKCPICHEIVPPNQYQQHYRMELAQLELCVSNPGPRGKRTAALAATKQFTKGKGRGSVSDNEKRDMLRDIQKRRTTRQSNKDSPTATGVAATAATGGSSRRGISDLHLGLAGELDDPLAPARCFICNERLFGSLDDINSHIDACLTNPRPLASNSVAHPSSSGTNTPVSGNASGRSSVATTPNERMVDSFEEYTWAGQTRIRATALFEGGMGSLGSGSGSRSVQEDVDDDLNVDDDEEDEYGGAQFTERDVVVNDADVEGEELREIALESSSAVQRAPSPPPPVNTSESLLGRRATQEDRARSRMDREVDIEDESADPGDVDDEEVDEDEEIDLEGDEDDGEAEEFRVNALISSAFATGDTKLVIEALRSKIKHLEFANKNVPTCLICLEPYTVPLTSIVCWHVHCEACWMQTLGSKKLCPQCQKITLPKDLRRIYL